MGDITAADGLQALVADLGRGNVIDAELLEGCPVEAHELDDMDADQAAQVAAHCFACLLYTSPSPRDKRQARMPSSA